MPKSGQKIDKKLTWTLKILSCTMLSLSSSLLLSVDNCKRPTKLILPRFCNFPFFLEYQVNSLKITRIVFEETNENKSQPRI